MTTTAIPAAAASREIMVQTLEVSIRVVHVGNRPMTISVYNQLPVIHDGYESDARWQFTADDISEQHTLIGWVNRHHEKCPPVGTHWHLLTVTRNEPTLLIFDHDLPDVRPAANLPWRHWSKDDRDWFLNWRDSEIAAGATVLEANTAWETLRADDIATRAAAFKDRDLIANYIASLPQLYIAR